MSKSTFMGVPVGGQITVTDAKGTRGPGTLTEIGPRTYRVRPDFTHFTASDTSWEAGETTWTFYHDETSDYGLTLTFEPFQPSPYDAKPATGFGTIPTYNGTPIKDLDRDGLLAVIEDLGLRVEPSVFRPETLFA